MSDPTYQPAVYREQGGNKLVVASTGSIVNEGTITNSGAGTITESYITLTVGSTLTAPLLPYGLSVVGSSSGATTYTLPVPTAAGVRKTICGSSSVNAGATISTTGDYLIGHTFNTIALTTQSASIELIGIPSGYADPPVSPTGFIWHVTGQSTAKSALSAV